MPLLSTFGAASARSLVVSVQQQQAQVLIYPKFFPRTFMTVQMLMIML